MTRPAFRPADLAKKWNVSVTTVHNMIQTGELHAFKVMTLYRISAEEVERIEGCVSSSTVENGPSSEAKTARSGEPRFGPVIVPSRNAVSVTSGRNHQGRR